MTVSEARAALHELLERVSVGEEVTITRHGQAVAVVVRPDVLRTRRAEGALAFVDKIRDLLSAARDASLPNVGGLSAARADELIAEVRAGRERRRA